MQIKISKENSFNQYIFSALSEVPTVLHLEQKTLETVLLVWVCIVRAYIPYILLLQWCGEGEKEGNRVNSCYALQGLGPWGKIYRFGSKLHHKTNPTTTKAIGYHCKALSLQSCKALVPQNSLCDLWWPSARSFLIILWTHTDYLTFGIWYLTFRFDFGMTCKGLWYLIIDCFWDYIIEANQNQSIYRKPTSPEHHLNFEGFLKEVSHFKSTIQILHSTFGFLNVKFQPVPNACKYSLRFIMQEQWHC